MMLLGVLVRPPLMIMGFLTAVIIMSVVGQFIGMSFKIFATSVSANHLTGLATIICMMFILGSLTIVLAHKIFGLITHLPENVTRWIGQQVQNLGEHQDEQRTRAIFGAVGSRGEGAATNALRPGLSPNKPGGGEEAAGAGGQSKVTGGRASGSNGLRNGDYNLGG